MVEAEMRTLIDCPVIQSHTSMEYLVVLVIAH